MFRFEYALPMDNVQNQWLINNLDSSRAAMSICLEMFLLFSKNIKKLCDNKGRPLLETHQNDEIIFLHVFYVVKLEDVFATHG